MCRNRMRGDTDRIKALTKLGSTLIRKSAPRKTLKCATSGPSDSVEEELAQLGSFATIHNWPKNKLG